jgi:hypothetical protein
MHLNSFMDKVCIEVVGQGDIGNRGVSLRTLGDDLGLEGLGIGTAFLWHGRPLKKAKNGVRSNLGGQHVDSSHWIDSLKNNTGICNS